MNDTPRKPNRPGRTGDDDPKWWDEEAQLRHDLAALRGCLGMLVDGLRYCAAEIRGERKRRRGKR